MKTRILSANSPKFLSEALKILNDGGLVAFPTDTVYGLGCLAFNDSAVISIYSAKDRPLEKAIPVLIGEIQDLEKVGTNIPESFYKIAKRFWPGPLTCVIQKQANLPRAVSASSTIGVRIPDHITARAILKASGPLAVTSANLSGHRSPVNAEEVRSQLNGRIPLIIDGGITPGGTPSTVVDFSSPEINILREGPITLGNLLSAL